MNTFDNLKQYIIGLLEAIDELTKVRNNSLPTEGQNVASVRIIVKDAQYSLKGTLLFGEYLCSVLIRGMMLATNRPACRYRYRRIGSDSKPFIHVWRKVSCWDATNNTIYRTG